MRILILCIILMFLNIFSYNLNASGLNSVFSKDGNDVWAVGFNGYIIHSTNGGSAWSTIPSGSTTYNSVCSGNQFVWIAGNAGTFQLSSDNGSSWNQQTLAGGVNLKTVYFINSSTGWIAGDNGTILKSTNSGLNWSTQISGVSNNLNSIIFIDNLNGASCGSNGTVLITTNGGSNWIQSVSPVAKELLSIDMKGNTIFASGADASVIKSTNNGSSWSIIDYKVQTKCDVNSVFMTDANSYYSCGGGGFIRKSTDAGVTFTFQVNPMLAGLNKIYFYNSNTGWACGKDNNVVLKTSDGGNTWQMPASVTRSFTWTRTLINNDNTGNVFSLNNLNKNEIFAISNQKIYRSLDLGSTWAQAAVIPYGNQVHSFIISPNDSNKFIVIADSISRPQHKVLYSSDYGVSWLTTFTGKFDPDGSQLFADPNHPDTVYLGPQDSLFYRSTNSGLTWQSTGSTRLGHICEVNVPYNNSNIILCAVSGNTASYVFKSTNYGANWFIADSNTGSVEAPQLAATIFHPNTIYNTFFGQVGGVHKSTDLGTHWVSIDTNRFGWAVRVAKDDPNVIAYGEWNTIKPSHISFNAGQSFINAGFTNEVIYSVLAFNRAVILAQGGGGFYKLNASYNNPIGIQLISTEVPSQFVLHQNYPNPFNPKTKIKFEVPSVGTVPGTVRLIIYNSLGQEITALVNEPLNAGVYEVSWNASDYPSGVYFYKLQSENFSESKKLILIK